MGALDFDNDLDEGPPALDVPPPNDDDAPPWRDDDDGPEDDKGQRTAPTVPSPVNNLRAPKNSVNELQESSESEAAKDGDEELDEELDEEPDDDDWPVDPGTDPEAPPPESPDEEPAGPVPPDKGQRIGPDKTDVGAGLRFVADHGDNLVFCGPMGGWLLWNGRRFRADETGESSELAKRTAGKVRREAAAKVEAAASMGKGPEAAEKQKAAARFYSWAMFLHDMSGLKRMKEAASTDPRVARSADMFDRDPMLFACGNGVIDLRTGRLKPASRSDLITRSSPVEFDPDAKAPLWEKWIRDIMGGDAEMVAFMQRFLGYSMTGSAEEEKLAVFWGGGSNGKSTLLEVTKHILGDYYQPLNTEVLLASKQGSTNAIESSRAKLKGTRLAVCAENSKTRAIDDGLLKLLASKDNVTGRLLRCDSITFPPTHNLILMTNNKPEIRATDEGTWRRIMLVPFNVQIPKGTEITGYESILLKEAPGILAWMVKGCLLWQKHGLSPCDAVKVATKSYRQSEDIIARFIETECFVGRNAEVGAASLWNAFNQWTGEAAERPMSQTAFGKAIASKGFAKVRASTYKYIGIGLLDTQRDARDSWDSLPIGLEKEKAASNLGIETIGQTIPTVPTLPFGDLRDDYDDTYRTSPS
jgi:putative DNA primase/helicase